MEEKGITADAVRLSKNILDSLLPDEKWAVCNIAIKDQEVFRLENYPVLPMIFGYKYDKTPILLQREGVIEAKVPNKWFIEVSYDKPEDAEVDILLGQVDAITSTAREKGYV